MPGALSVSGLPPAGSPFVVGRPLRAQEPIFGRDAVLRALGDALAHGSSVNLVAMRRMGKTSLLNHLRGHPARWLPPRPDRPPRLLAAVDLQGHITGANRFYAAALRALWLALPVSDRPPDGPARLADPAGITYEVFQEALSDLTEGADVPRQPVLLLDEFERLLADDARTGFPFPGFFDGLRALITADVLTVVVASQRPLADYFSDPVRAFSLTSTFPSYFIPCPLPPLDDAAADALLLQESDHPLSLAEVRKARTWADGHPCHLQAAGQAWYEAHVEGRPAAWTESRFQEIKRQACLAGKPPLPPPAAAAPPALSTAQIHALVDALLGCAAMQDRGLRDTVVGDLPPAIRHAITRRDRDREDVRHILGAALAYPDGLVELVKVVRFYEGDSLGMRALAQVLEGRWRL